MRELLNFILRHGKWFIFVFYVVVGCWMLFQNNPYQHHVFLTSANEVSASVYRFTNNVTSYFSLRDINEDLNRRNADLQLEVIALRERLRTINEAAGLDSSDYAADTLRHFDLRIAHVINNSVSHPYNYITINKGALDGIRPEMGVVDQNGVVGVVNIVGDHTSRIISLLNTHFRLSCKVKGSDGFGSLVWDGRDPAHALLEELPRHTVFQPGDTVITSGYSGMFPEGIPVGIVMPDKTDNNENFFTLKIRLLTDFSTLSTVQVMFNNLKDELRVVETDPMLKKQQ